MHATSIKLLKLVKPPLNVASRKVNVTNWLFICVILPSKKKKEPFFSNCKVNLMFGCLVLMLLTKCFKSDWQRNSTKISSAYLLKTFGKILGGSF